MCKLQWTSSRQIQPERFELCFARALRSLIIAEACLFVVAYVVPHSLGCHFRDNVENAILAGMCVRLGMVFHYCRVCKHVSLHISGNAESKIISGRV